MNINFDNYKSGYKIVSLALTEAVKNDFADNNLQYIYLNDGLIRLFPDDIILSNSSVNIKELSECNNYDVFEIWENGRVYRKYNDKSNDNFIVITGKCNSNCLICPSPEKLRKDAHKINIPNLIDFAKHIPEDTPHLTITGGEPFMVGEDIFPFLSFLKERFKNTEFLFLTNGRVFAITKYAKKFKENAPYLSTVAIPLYGSCSKTHDNITCTNNSFNQTIQGIKALIKDDIKVELRFVINKLNENDFNNTAELIVREFKKIGYVSIMALEMTGNTRINKEKVWLPYKEAFAAIKSGIMILMANGIDVKLYNFPLCTVEKPFYTLCQKSISQNKIRYTENCNLCVYKQDCGGVFAGTLQFEAEELKAIQ